MAPSQTEEEFRSEQQRLAAEQGQTAPNAVPEQRPQASTQFPEHLQSETAKKLDAEGFNDPMPKSAYEKAASAAQAKAAAKEEKALGLETLREGAVVRIISGPYEGAYGAIVAVSWKNADERAKAVSGDQAIARFAKAASYTVNTRGTSSTIVVVKPTEVEEAPRNALNPSAPGA